MTEVRHERESCEAHPIALASVSERREVERQGITGQDGLGTAGERASRPSSKNTEGPVSRARYRGPWPSVIRAGLRKAGLDRALNGSRSGQWSGETAMRGAPRQTWCMVSNASMPVVTEAPVPLCLW